MNQQQGTPHAAQETDAVRLYVPTALALAAAAAAVWRMIALDDREKAFDEVTLLYLGVAALLLFARDIDFRALSKLSIGKFQAEFTNRVEKLEVTTAQALETAQTAQSTAILAVGSEEPRPAEEAPAGAEEEMVAGPEQEDPWKGRFGGASTANNRELYAEVARSAGRSDWFDVTLRVRSTRPLQDPLRGRVRFFLHPTFANSRPWVKVSPDGVAELRLTAWGAFTVGALADDDRTRLELDLARVESAPVDFQLR